MVTTLGAAFAAAAVAVVAFSGSLMTTFCAAAADGVVLWDGLTSATTPAPAPPPITAPATRPAMPIRSRPERRVCVSCPVAGRPGPPAIGMSVDGGSPPPGGTVPCQAGTPKPGVVCGGICVCGCGGAHPVACGIAGC